MTYVDRYGKSWTTERRKFFFDGADPDLTPIPSAANVVQAVLGNTTRDGSHPRIIPRVGGVRMTGPELLAKINSTDLRASFETFQREADTLKDAGGSDPVSEPVKTADAPDAVYIQSQAIEKLLIRAYILGTAGNAHANEAKRRLLKLAAWNAEDTGTTSEWGHDQANRTIYLTLAFGLDMLYGSLEDGEKEKLLVALKTRLGYAVQRMDHSLLKPDRLYFGSLVGLPYDSHSLVGAQFTASASMLATGMSSSKVSFDNGPVGESLAKSWTRAVTVLGAWSGDEDSAFGNGTNYGWMNLINTTPALAKYLIISDVNLTRHHPALASFGNNALAFTPRATKPTFRSPFGDGANDTWLYKAYAAKYFQLFANISGRKADEWYHLPASTLDAEISLPFENYLVRAMVSPATPEAPVRKDYLFEAAGLVAMHTDPVSLDRSSVFFRSSYLGSYNHSHADNNAFTMVSRGQDVFISGGYYKDNFGSDLHAKYTRATRFKNAITYCDDAVPTKVNDSYTAKYTCAGFGQAELGINSTTPGAPEYSLKASGKLVNYHADESKWSIVTGDATKSYQKYDASTKTWTPALTAAIRTIAYNRTKGMLFIYDRLDSAVPRHWQFNFQTLAAPLRDSSNPKKAAISNVCLRFHGLNGSFYTQNMAAIAPAIDDLSKTELTKQYHTTYTTEKNTASASLTVIAENCAEVDKPDVKYVGQAISATYGGTTLIFDKETVRVSE